jgi:hypothetical protein
LGNLVAYLPAASWGVETGLEYEIVRRLVGVRVMRWRPLC